MRRLHPNTLGRPSPQEIRVNPGVLTDQAHWVYP